MKLSDIINEAVKLTDDQIKERLAQAKELAKNYKNPRQFSLDHYALWGFLRSYGFVDQVFPKRNKYQPTSRWDASTIPNEAAKYSNRTEFRLGNQIAYAKANELGLLGDLFPERKEHNRKYDLKKSIDLAKNFNGIRSEFLVKHSTAYYILRDNNLLDFYLPVKSNKKNDEQELLDKAKDYTTHFVLKKENPELYQKLINRGILDLAFDRKKIWDDRKNEKVLKAKEYESVYDLRKKDPALYNYLSKNDLLDDAFGENRKYFNLIKKAKEYSNRYELLKNKRHVYKKLESLGLLDDIFPKQLDVDEGRSRKEMGSGIDHLIYPSTTDPNIVYKLGSKPAINYWFKEFNENPDIFPKVYKRGTTKIKLKDNRNVLTKNGYVNLKAGTVIPVDYVELEKLDTKRVEKEWDMLDQMFEEIMEIDDYGFLDFLILHMTNTPQAREKGHDYGDTIEKMSAEIKTNYQNLYPIFMRYVELTDKIKAVKPGVPDLHRYNFGYDKNGNLKCLDF